MNAHFQRQIDSIKKQILSLGGMVEDRFKRVSRAVQAGDAALAQAIIQADSEIDDMEVAIEEECLKIIALYQPVAFDLRFLIAVIKINNDLERVADQAVNIAQRIRTIAGRNLDKFEFDYSLMSDTTRLMLKKSLDALVSLDSGMAHEVRIMDKTVNTMRNDAYDAMKTAILRAPDHVGTIINQYLISRHLERIGDHASNIAEEVIHMTEGRIVRHDQ